jgi:hypothetical protein
MTRPVGLSQTVAAPRIRAGVAPFGVPSDWALGGVHARVQTGTERFSNHAEWVSVTTSRWGHLLLSLRFPLVFRCAIPACSTPAC